MNQLESLIEAENKAFELFKSIEQLQLIVPGKKESELNAEIFELAKSQFGIEKFWHKRIVRAGKNTLLPYRENPPDLILQENDILFFDFGPVFEEWEADIGKTYVLGNDPEMLQLSVDVVAIWKIVNNYYQSNQESITASELYEFTCKTAQSFGWNFGNEHAGHIIGQFPHEKIHGDDVFHYIHPKNNTKMSEPASNGLTRNWILEIHLIHSSREIGAFHEQLMIP